MCWNHVSLSIYMSKIYIISPKRAKTTSLFQINILYFVKSLKSDAKSRIKSLMMTTNKADRCWQISFFSLYCLCLWFTKLASLSLKSVCILLLNGIFSPVKLCCSSVVFPLKMHALRIWVANAMYFTKAAAGPNIDRINECIHRCYIVVPSVRWMCIALKSSKGEEEIETKKSTNYTKTIDHIEHPDSVFPALFAIYHSITQLDFYNLFKFLMKEKEGGGETCKYFVIEFDVGFTTCCIRVLKSKTSAFEWITFE